MVDRGNKMYRVLRNALVAMSLLPGVAFADATQEQISQLGGVRTATGSEKAGSADGSVPAWTGLNVTTTMGRQFTDPFASETPLMRIDRGNLDQHRDKLSVGQIAMIERYPDFFINVYPTHRIYELPPKVKDHVRAEAGGINLVGGGQGITGLNLSPVAFPFPENGVEALWNHLTRYRSAAFERTYIQAPVQTNGAYTLQRLRDTTIFRPRLVGKDGNENMLLKFMQEILAPARLEGTILLVHDHIDQLKDPRAAWIYNAGQRRVRRAPNIAYDGPGTAAEGMRTVDDFDLFNGSPDKYDWKLIGRSEMYVPSNSFGLADPDLKYTDLIGKDHLNQEYPRYELRRVWIVDGTLRDGERHIYGRRTYYLDEDSWFIVLGDLYDNRGELWRVREGHAALESETRVLIPVGEPVYDLQANRYLALSFLSEENPQFDFDVELTDRDFTPGALRRAGRK
ncbi:MAG: DUF1329 domain-containing protein [Pseudomonadota bacterium]